MKLKPTKSIHSRQTSKHNPYLLYFILLFKVKHQSQIETEIDVFFFKYQTLLNCKIPTLYYLSALYLIFKSNIRIIYCFII